MTGLGCGAPAQTPDLPAGVDAERETVLAGVVSAGDDPVGGAYVRLLDETGEFTAEVVTSPTGDFRFFAAPGTWTLSVLHRSARLRSTLHVHGAGVTRTTLDLAGGSDGGGS